MSRTPFLRAERLILIHAFGTQEGKSVEWLWNPPFTDRVSLW